MRNRTHFTILRLQWQLLMVFLLAQFQLRSETFYNHNPLDKKLWAKRPLVAWMLGYPGTEVWLVYLAEKTTETV